MVGKRRLKELVYGCEVRSFSIIVEGLANRAPRRKILGEVKKEVRKVGFAKTSEANRLLRDIVKMYRSLAKEVSKKRRVGEETVENVYALARSYISKMEKVKNKIANDIEYEDKFEAKMSMFNSDNVFYICNWFEDCAEDHVPYQGKIYYNKRALARITSPKVLSEVLSCISNRNLKSVQEVTDNKPWLMTRRNCRHRFHALSIEEVLHSSTSKILSKHGLRFKHENEYNTVMTPEKTNYVMYYERLKALLMMRKYIPNTLLEEDIKQTRIRARLWKSKIKGKG